MSETNKKSPRTFQCRDALWNRFEEMARELECSVDYLVNDAMKQYARTRGFTPASSPNPSLAPGAHSSPTAGAQPPPVPQSNPRASSPKPTPLPQPLLAASASAMPMAVPATPAVAPPSSLPPVSSRATPPPLPRTASLPPRPPVPPVLPPSAGGSRLSPLPLGALPATSAAPPPPPPPRGAGSGAQRGLTIYYQGIPHQVTKDNFVIGRGKQSSDLTIRDPNISRQHAYIEYAGGAFWMVDMGSTNGVEFNGQRVQRKQIQNGDVYRICSHELVMQLV